MQVTALLAGIALIGLLGCTPATELRDQYRTADRDLSFDQRLRFELGAPIIVLGHVIEFNEIGQPQPSTGDNRIKVQLTRIKIEVEVVVKGDARSNPSEFFYFTYSPMASEVDLGALRYLPIVGQRRIFFLRPSKGGYRSVGDVTDYTLRVYSGTHQRGFCGDESPGCCIARLLLVPQHDVDVARFVTYLLDTEYAAEVLCSPHTAQSLLQRLVEHSDRRIADGARDVIAHAVARQTK